MAYLALQQDENRWRLMVPPTAIGALAKELITMPKPAVELLNLEGGHLNQRFVIVVPVTFGPERT